MPSFPLTPEFVEEALRDVYDPELGVNVVDLGLVYGVAVEEGRVLVTMTLTTPGCPLHASIQQAVDAGVRRAFPDVEEVAVELVWEPPWTPHRVREAGRRELGWT